MMQEVEVHSFIGFLNRKNITTAKRMMLIIDREIIAAVFQLLSPASFETKTTKQTHTKKTVK